MELRTESILKCKRKKEVKEIYRASFPASERMPFVMMVLMSLLWNTQFNVFYDGETLCGFVYMATIGRQTFIMFFAVDEKYRNKGYGSAILDAVQTRHPKNRIIVSIEPCETTDESNIRNRRKAFYCRNGFAETGYYLSLYSKKQEVLIKNGTFGRWKFFFFILLYGNCVMIPIIWKIK